MGELNLDGKKEKKYNVLKNLKYNTFKNNHNNTLIKISNLTHIFKLH